MTALFDSNEEIDLMLSYTKATLPHNKKEYTLVIVYGLSEEKPMKLLTNININEKEDAIKIATEKDKHKKILYYIKGTEPEETDIVFVEILEEN